MDDGYFGESIAGDYDDSTGVEFDPAVVGATANVLAELAGGGRALELGIGTGRVALPLARRGVEVHGIDLSRPMVSRLRAKPGGANIPVTIGDIATARAGEGFDLVYLIFNTIMNLTGQQDQVECFRNAAAHLRPGGRFLVEVMVPELRKLPPGQTAVPFLESPEKWGFDTYDVATQSMASNYLTLENGKGTFSSIPFRYVWPAELDLMAQLAGMVPEDRWGSWARVPFTSESPKHISTWIKAR